ncbi:molybdenum ABC transporter ATP-binding protein [Chelatococcus asaccharovorans]|uniref:molybdenum ABC transporter ATP-binding protein n=1 Tax=Chelatococcus asaccharovorans TaxID=28210 RepID=UPI00224C7897|nr:molybdenum ABC transporter ATP-binding protein [Chelatococcus asaccharovorans]CAH1671689.1 molybdate ABC transporter ATP binding subunit [Chelatococcus asaccharovorans]CAH1676901.1 molybdate ABC transporter ATP binding subunit [Chelatococcus asaccharovorans]
MSIDIDVTHRFGAFRLAARFTGGAGVTALFGRSGSGKTSLINIIGGLLRPDRGRVVIDGVTLVDTDRGIFVQKHRRRLGYVFQEARLFPHMSVRRNLLYGRGFVPAGERIAMEPIVAMLGIGHLLERRPAGLSGGEKQRVAIGRALLASPRLLLMDEPLAALDESRKGEILPYIERLRDEMRLPIVYVSHSVAEVARLATTLVVLNAGEVAAAGPAAEVMQRLDLSPLTGPEGTGAVIDGTVAAQDERYGLTLVATPAGELRIPSVAKPVGAPVRLHIRARDVMLADRRPEGLSALNIIAGVIAEIGSPVGAAVEIRLDCQGVPLVARLTRLSLDRLGLAPGRTVFAVVKAVSFLPEEPGKREGSAADAAD